MPSQKPGFSFFDKRFQWVDYRLHTNETYPELNPQTRDRYLVSVWLDGLAKGWIQNTRVQFKRALPEPLDLS